MSEKSVLHPRTIMDMAKSIPIRTNIEYMWLVPKSPASWARSRARRPFEVPLPCGTPYSPFPAHGIGTCRSSGYIDRQRISLFHSASSSSVESVPASFLRRRSRIVGRMANSRHKRPCAIEFFVSISQAFHAANMHKAAILQKFLLHPAGTGSACGEMEKSILLRKGTAS